MDTISRAFSSSVAALSDEITCRRWDRSRTRHRKTDFAFQEFCVEVAFALTKAGEPVKNHPRSLYARSCVSCLRMPVNECRKISRGTWLVPSKYVRNEFDVHAP